MIIGRVVSHSGKSSPNQMEFPFQVMKGYEPRMGDYVRVRTSGSSARFILGQVTLVHAGNMYLDDPRIVSIYLESSEEAPQGYGLYELDNWECGVARIIGTLSEDSLEFTGHSPKPGDEVDLLDPTQLKHALAIPDSGLFLAAGTTSQGEYEIRLPTIDTLTHNMMICGRIGSGKTYTGGVLIEEFLDQGISVLAIDPHGELGTLAEPNDNQEQASRLNRLGIETKGYATRLFSPPDFAIGNISPFAVPLGLLTNDELLNLIDENGEMGDRQKHILAVVQDRAHREKGGPDYSVNDLLKHIDRHAVEHKNEEERAIGIKVRVKKLIGMKIFRPEHALDPSSLLQNGTATIITLPGVGDSVQRAVVAVLARSLLKARMDGRVPRFLFYVDEGHIFAPTGANVPSKAPLIRFAKECRKFGAGICIVSQQPADISDRIKSQCHTRIFLQLDSQSDMNYVRSSITDHWKELVEMIPFFPPGRAILRSKSFRFPLLIQIRPRRSKHKTATEMYPPGGPFENEQEESGGSENDIEQGGEEKQDSAPRLEQFH
jgi:hypothetical protein